MADVGGKNISDADRERVSRMMGRPKKAILQETGNEGAAESQMILKLIQKMAQEEAEAGAVKRGNMVAAKNTCLEQPKKRLNV